LKEKNKNIENRLSNKHELLFIIQVLSDDLSTDYTNLHRLDFVEFIRLIKHHRLDSIFLKAVNEQNIDLPTELKENIEVINKRNKMRMMKLTSELIRIHKLFTENNIDYISLKGPALSQQIYGDYTIRSSRDLDILVRVEDLDKVNLLLNSIEYFNNVKSFEKHQKAHHDIEFINKNKKIKLEIHTRLFSIKEMFKDDNNALFNKFETILVNNTEVKILNNKTNNDYLYTHAKNHSWELLYWIIDLIKINDKNNNIELINNFLINNNKRNGRLTYFIYLFSLNKSVNYKFSVFYIHFIRFRNWLMPKRS
jgi:hypothetical protein